MQIPSLADFDRLERKIDRCLTLLAVLNDQDRYVFPQDKILTVKDVNIEFKISPHIQRLARGTGKLLWISGTKEVRYHRSDVETWIKSNKIQ